MSNKKVKELEFFLARAPGDINVIFRGTANQVFKELLGGEDKEGPFKFIEAKAVETPIIKAAPEMYELLEEWYERFGDDDPFHHRVANLLAKIRPDNV